MTETLKIHPTETDSKIIETLLSNRNVFRKYLQIEDKIYSLEFTPEFREFHKAKKLERNRDKYNENKERVKTRYLEKRQKELVEKYGDKALDEYSTHKRYIRNRKPKPAKPPKAPKEKKVKIPKEKTENNYLKKLKRQALKIELPTNSPPNTETTNSPKSYKSDKEMFNWEPIQNYEITEIVSTNE